MDQVMIERTPQYRIGKLVAALAMSLALNSYCSASIETITFTRITSTASQDIASQLFADVLDPSQVATDFPSIYADFITKGSDVLFVFRNAVGIVSNIHEIYFMDGTIMAQTAIYNSLGGFTNYTPPPLSPANLPSGNNATPAFLATTSFGAETQGNPSNGINASADKLGMALLTNSTRTEAARGG